MNRDLPVTFGRSAADCARSAVILAVLGIAAVWGLGRMLMRPESPLAAPLMALGIAPVVVPLVGTGVVLALAMAGYGKSLRSRPIFRITDGGLEVVDGLGEYRLDWENLECAGEAAGGALGLKARSREAVLATHSGTDCQREWLRTLPPYGEWDFLYPRSDLGCPAGKVLEWIRAWQSPGEEQTVG